MPRELAVKLLKVFSRTLANYPSCLLKLIPRSRENSSRPLERASRAARVSQAGRPGHGALHTELTCNKEKSKVRTAWNGRDAGVFSTRSGDESARYPRGTREVPGKYGGNKGRPGGHVKGTHDMKCVW